MHGHFLFDARFFLYFEDMDLCFRAKTAGYKSVICKKAAFQRMCNGTLGEKNPLTFYYLTRNLFLFVKKQYPDKSLQRDRFKRIFKALRWDVFGYYFPMFLKTKKINYIHIVFKMAQGSLDFFRGKFGGI